MSDEEAALLDQFLYIHTRGLPENELKSSVPFMLHCVLQSRHQTENLVEAEEDEDS